MVRARRTLVAVLSTVLAAAAATAAAPPQVREYVALGDSYTSGPFIPWMRLDPLGCGRSTRDYPADLARALGPVELTDVSCSGATTGDLTAAQRVPLGTNPPQLDALSGGTDLVTVGIGGNDSGVFGDVVATCPRLRAQDPTGAPCRDHFTAGGTDVLEQRIAATEPRLEAVLEQVRDRAPGAEVLLVGYPSIAPAAGTCPDVLPFADGDYAYLNSLERDLNDVLAKSAANTGTRYVDTFGPSAGHDACGSGGTPWVNGRRLRIFAAAPYHPNAAGMAGVASIVGDALAGRAPDTAKAELAARKAAYEAKLARLAALRGAGGGGSDGPGRVAAHRLLARFGALR